MTKWVERQEYARLDEEQKRLFYVACTRAQQGIAPARHCSEIKRNAGKTGEIAYTSKKRGRQLLIADRMASPQTGFPSSFRNMEAGERYTRAATASVTTIPLREASIARHCLDMAAAAEERHATLRRLPDNLRTSASPAIS